MKIDLPLESLRVRPLAVQQNRRLQLLRKMLPVKLLVHIQLTFRSLLQTLTRSQIVDRYGGWQI